MQNLGSGGAARGPPGRTPEPGTGCRGGVVSLSNVWVQTLADGLVQADQIIGIDAHQTRR